ncbi:MAG: HNH endonuclease [Magnetococcus sp. WYHC-3]
MPPESDPSLDLLFIAADPDVMAAERNKARELKQSAWWKSRKGQGRCHYCGRRVPPAELTLDHVVPLVRGGRTSRSNCVPACQECNHAKRHLPPGVWQARLESMRSDHVDEL